MTPPYRARVYESTEVLSISLTPQAAGLPETHHKPQPATRGDAGAERSL